MRENGIAHGYQHNELKHDEYSRKLTLTEIMVYYFYCFTYA
jgi:hypothetical protein